MNRSEFLSKLKAHFERCAAARDVQVVASQFAPPDPEAAAAFAKKHPGLLPNDLLQFYSEIAAECNAEYRFDFSPPKLFAGDRRLSMLRGGLQLLALKEVEEAIESLREMFDFFIERAAGAKKQALQKIAPAIVPLFVQTSADFLVWIRENGEVPPGLYFIFYGELGEVETYIKYADTFDEWLAFLEDNLYLGEDWREAELFLGKGRLVSNPAVTDELKRLFKM